MWTILVSKDVKFLAHLLYVKSLSQHIHLPQGPRLTQKLKSVCSILSSKETGSSSVSLKMIFGALQFELFRFKIHSLSTKILKFPKFNLRRTYRSGQHRYLMDRQHLGIGAAAVEKLQKYCTNRKLASMFDLWHLLGFIIVIFVIQAFSRCRLFKIIQTDLDKLNQKQNLYLGGKFCW